MARKTATFISCDGPGCGHVTELTEQGTPPGWYAVQPVKDGQYDPKARFEFHTLRCMERWANGRRKALEGKGFRRSTGPTPESERERQIVEALRAMEKPLLVSEIVDLLGLEKSAAHRTINKLLAEERIVEVEQRRGPYGAKYAAVAEAVAA